MDDLRNQRGSALIFVTIVGLVVTMAFALFINSTVLVEERAVEAELARTRAYWAEMGAFNYSLSRISYSRLCNGCTAGNNKDTDLAVVWNAYFSELGTNSWSYADESPGYTISLTEASSADDSPTRQTFSGWLMTSSSYVASPVVAASAGPLPKMEMRLCVGLNNSGAKCGNINNNNGGKATAYFSINRLTNVGG